MGMPQVDGHLQMWWCTMPGPASGANPEEVLVILHAGFGREVTGGTRIAVLKPYYITRVANRRVIIVPSEACVHLM
jgi:hypothetical protein